MNSEVFHALDRMPEKEIVAQFGWDVFLRCKVATYQRQPDTFRWRFSLLTYLGMTAQEYGEWVVYGEISDRVKRVWS